jgi:hypothetical protein
MKLTDTSTSIEFGPYPLVDFGERDPNVRGATVVRT